MIHALKQLYEKLYVAYWRTKANKVYRRLKNVIIFESVPDVSDNTKAVFDEFLRRGLNKKYKLVWILNKTQAAQYPTAKNVLYLPHWTYKLRYYRHVAKVIICCNEYLKKENEKQLMVYLSHGTAIKSVRGYYALPTYMDCFVTASPAVTPMQCYEFDADPTKAVPLGFPRNDIFAHSPTDVKRLFNEEYQKIIVWYPTFRQQTGGVMTGSKEALPIIHDGAFAKKLNDVAVENGVLIVIKPHFAQDLQYIKTLALSNIRFIDDAFFQNNGIGSYEFVHACDALITDYSSIYFDYTLCNKPIAAIWEDIEEYKQKPGLVENYEYLMKGAEKIYTIEDFIGFIGRIADGVDLLKAERDEIRDYANISTDGKNSTRVTEHIIEKAKLK